MAGVRYLVPVLWLWGPVAVQAALIYHTSSIPNLRDLPGGIPDWLGHGIGYAVLGGLLLRALAGGRRAGVTPKAAMVAVLLAVLYGLSDEWHQSFVPGRSPSVADLGADAIGAALTVAVAWALTARRRV